MKKLLTCFILIFALVVSVFACKYAAPKFKLKATDGKTYTEKQLIQKPTLILFLKPDCPMVKKAMPQLNRLTKELKGKVSVIAFVPGELGKIKAFSKEQKAVFPLLADPNGKVAAGFKADASLDFTVVAGKEEARFPQIWKGLSRGSVLEALDMVTKHGYAVPKLKVEWISKGPIQGCSL